MWRKILKWTFSLILFVTIVTYAIFVVLGGGFGVREDHAIPANDNSMVFAHRGVSIYQVENSMEGYINSEALGFHALEIDVRKTKDHRLVLFHDKSCKRKLGIDEDITNLDYERVKDAYLIDVANHKPSQSKISTLDEVLAKFGSRMIVYLDIKDVNKVIADSLLLLIKKHNAYRSVLVADQSVVFLSYLKYKEPKIKTVLERFYGVRAWTYSFIPKKFKPDYYGSFLREVDDDHVEFLKAKKILERKIVYGVDSSNLADVYAFGIPHVIIDYDSSLQSIPEIENLLKQNSD
jgi:glycerophosphoryl diester phosphodiesterase